MSATESGSSITNLDAVAETWEKKKSQDRSRALDRAKDLSTQRWLEQKLEEQASPVEIYDREFKFQPVGNGVLGDILEMTRENAEQIDADEVEGIEDVQPDDLDDMPELLGKVRSVLAEHCLDPEMTEEAFGKLPADDLMSTFESVAMSAGMNASEAERAQSFRGD